MTEITAIGTPETHRETLSVTPPQSPLKIDFERFSAGGSEVEREGFGVEGVGFELDAFFLDSCVIVDPSWHSLANTIAYARSFAASKQYIADVSGLVEIRAELAEVRSIARRTQEMVSELMGELRQVTAAIHNLSQNDADDPGDFEETRKVTQKQAEKEIMVFFQQHGTLSYSDMADSLGLDIETIVAACDLLVEQGRIEPQD